MSLPRAFARGLAPRAALLALLVVAAWPARTPAQGLAEPAPQARVKDLELVLPRAPGGPERWAAPPPFAPRRPRRGRGPPLAARRGSGVEPGAALHRATALPDRPLPQRARPRPPAAPRLATPGTGSRSTVEAQAQRRLARVSVRSVGPSALPEDTLRAAARLSPGDPFDDADLEAATARVRRDALARKGYRQPRIEPPCAAGTSVAVDALGRRGPPLRVRAVRAQGDAGRAGRVRRRRGSPPGPAPSSTSDRLAEDARTLRAALYAAGLPSGARGRRRRSSTEGGEAVVTFPVDAGPRMRCSGFAATPPCRARRWSGRWAWSRTSRSTRPRWTPPRSAAHALPRPRLRGRPGRGGGGAAGWRPGGGLPRARKASATGWPRSASRDPRATRRPGSARGMLGPTWPRTAAGRVGRRRRGPAAGGLAARRPAPARRRHAAAPGRGVLRGGELGSGRGADGGELARRGLPGGRLPGQPVLAGRQADRTAEVAVRFREGPRTRWRPWRSRGTGALARRAGTSAPSRAGRPARLRPGGGDPLGPAPPLRLARATCSRASRRASSSDPQTHLATVRYVDRRGAGGPRRPHPGHRQPPDPGGPDPRATCCSARAPSTTRRRPPGASRRCSTPASSAR